MILFFAGLPGPHLISCAGIVWNHFSTQPGMMILTCKSHITPVMANAEERPAPACPTKKSSSSSLQCLPSTHVWAWEKRSLARWRVRQVMLRTFLNWLQKKGVPEWKRVSGYFHFDSQLTKSNQSCMGTRCTDCASNLLSTPCHCFEGSICSFDVFDGGAFWVSEQYHFCS